MKNYLELLDLLPRPRLAREGWWRVAFTGLAWQLDLAFLRWLAADRPIGENQKRLLLTLARLLNNLTVSLFAYTLFYYSDPLREPEGNSSEHIYSPVDGRVISVEDVDEPRFINGRARCVTIKVGLFNLALLRSPVQGQLRYIFFEALQGTRQNFYGFETAKGQNMLVSHGWRFGRNLCPPPLGDTFPSNLRIEAGAPVATSQIIGSCGFGTGTILKMYLPVNDRIEEVVVKGMPVRAGKTIMGRFLSGD